LRLEADTPAVETAIELLQLNQLDRVSVVAWTMCTLVSGLAAGGRWPVYCELPESRIWTKPRDTNLITWEVEASWQPVIVRIDRDRSDLITPLWHRLHRWQWKVEHEGDGGGLTRPEYLEGMEQASDIASSQLEVGVGSTQPRIRSQAAQQHRSIGRGPRRMVGQAWWIWQEEARLSRHSLARGKWPRTRCSWWERRKKRFVGDQHWCCLVWCARTIDELMLVLELWCFTAFVQVNALFITVVTVLSLLSMPVSVDLGKQLGS
jgi:hypothetical protein